MGFSYPLEIRNLEKEIMKARRKWQQTTDSNDKNIVNSLIEQLKNETQALKEKSMKGHLSKLTADRETDYSLGKATNKLKTNFSSTTNQ